MFYSLGLGSEWTDLGTISLSRCKKTLERESSKRNRQDTDGKGKEKFKHLNLHTRS